MAKDKKSNAVSEEKKTLALQIVDINNAAFERRKAFRESQKEKALQDLIASQKSSRGPSRSGRLTGATSIGGGSGSRKAVNLGK